MRALLAQFMVLAAACGAVLAGACGSAGSASETRTGEPPPNEGPFAAPERLRVQVDEVRPHDRSSFTQGFELVDGVLYEGTGQIGQSAVLATDPVTGVARQRVDLAPPLFGEGITVVGDRIWQLTWRDEVAIERDRSTLAERRRVEYDGEGWGLCFDGERLVMSDGSDRLTFRDPETFDVTGQVTVRSSAGRVDELNELECVDGAVWANVWQTDTILRIDPASGAVTGIVDATGLLAEHGDPSGNPDVLNGIAADGDRFLLTGKLWPNTFVVRFVPA